MNRSGYCRVLPFLFVLGVAGFSRGRVPPASPFGPKLPKEPCALLTPAEIQAAVAPGAKVGAGVRDTSAAPLAVSCSYTWGPRTPQWGESSITVMVMDVTKAWPDLSAAQIQQGMLAGSRSPGESASPLAGVGDAAVFTVKSRSHDASAQAVFSKKAEHLSVEFHGGDAGSKERVIGLLKRAAARL